MNISAALQVWYQQNKRPLPWRQNRDPYFIWISEIMLQQTTVNVVIPYFEKFIAAFPTIKALALAPEEKVMSLWSGLGYYSRARNLQKAAQAIVAAGKVPKTYAAWIELSGIGPYTAAAIASQAFDENVAAVDGNVIRVISRLFDIKLDVATKAGIKQVNALATELIAELATVPVGTKAKPTSAGEHNQAMMELGATICTPRSPACLICPVAHSCMSFKNGTTALRPVKQKNRKQEPWLWQIFLVIDGGRIALVKSTNGTPWLKNTWVLPGRASPWLGAKPPASDFRHSITHHKIFVQIKKPKSVKLDLENARWVKPADIENLGVSSIVQKIIRSAYFEKHIK